MTGVHFTGVLVPFTGVLATKLVLTRFALRLLFMVLLSFMSGSRSPAVPYLEVTALGEPRSWRRGGGEGGGEGEGRREGKGEGEGKGGGRGEGEVG